MRIAVSHILTLYQLQVLRLRVLNMSEMTIGKLAKKTSVTVETIRYYERRGLLPTPHRTPAGYRLYPPDAVKQLQFIKRARELAFSLDEVSQLLSLRDGGPEACEVVQRMAKNRAELLAEKIGALQASKDKLDGLIALCDDAVAGPCAILDALDPDALTADTR